MYVLVEIGSNLQLFPPNTISNIVTDLLNNLTGNLYKSLSQLLPLLHL